VYAVLNAQLVPAHVRLNVEVNTVVVEELGTTRISCSPETLKSAATNPRQRQVPSTMANFRHALLIGCDYLTTQASPVSSGIVDTIIPETGRCRGALRNSLADEGGWIMTAALAGRWPAAR
jgi:predicted PP-loop superfamily ATPase